MLPMVDCSAGGWWPPGCGLVSQANDDFASSVTSYFAGILESMASWMWSFISGAFGVSDIDQSQWTTVSGITNWWIVVMMTPLVVVMIIQLLSGLISQQPRRIGRALFAGAVAVPLVFLTVSLMAKLSSFTDAASNALLATLGKDPFVVFMRLFGFQKAAAGSGRDWDAVSLSSGTTGGPQGAVIVTVIAIFVVWALAFILMCSMIFRSFALVVLAAVAPVALMLLPWERTKSWTRLWSETVVALLIAKPLAATVLAVAVKLFANSSSFSGLASGAVGMLLACGAPLMALKLVSFAGGEIAGAAQLAGGGHVTARVGSFTGRQLGRQLGGKMHTAGISKHGPAPVLSKPTASHMTPTAPTVGATPSATRAEQPRDPTAGTKGRAHAGATSRPVPGSGRHGTTRPPNPGTRPFAGSQTAGESENPQRVPPTTPSAPTRQASPSRETNPAQQTPMKGPGSVSSSEGSSGKGDDKHD